MIIPVFGILALPPTVVKKIVGDLGIIPLTREAKLISNYHSVTSPYASWWHTHCWDDYESYARLFRL